MDEQIVVAFIVVGGGVAFVFEVLVVIVKHVVVSVIGAVDCSIGVGLRGGLGLLATPCSSCVVNILILVAYLRRAGNPPFLVNIKNMKGSTPRVHD